MTGPVVPLAPHHNGTEALMTGQLLPKQPSWDELHKALAEVRARCTDLGIRLRALAEVWDAMGQYEGKNEYQRGTARTYAQAAGEIRLLLGEE